MAQITSAHRRMDPAAGLSALELFLVAVAAIMVVVVVVRPQDV
jgi:hypothetical protein